MVEEEDADDADDDEDEEQEREVAGMADRVRLPRTVRRATVKDADVTGPSRGWRADRSTVTSDAWRMDVGP